MEHLRVLHALLELMGGAFDTVWDFHDSQFKLIVKNLKSNRIIEIMFRALPMVFHCQVSELY